MLESINETANKAINGNFVAEITKLGEKFLVSVKHHNSDEDPCAGQSQVVSELYKVLGACNLNKAGAISHSGGCASVEAEAETAVEFQIANYDVKMTRSQADRWNSADITEDDAEKILVYVPVPQNHYKVVKLSDLDEETRSFMEDFEAQLN